MKSLMVSLFCVACCGAQPFPGSAAQADRAYSNTYNLTVSCVGPKGFSEFGGSAFAISSRHLVTAWHVVSCRGVGTAWEIRAENRDGVVYTMEIDKRAKVDAVRLVVVGVGAPFHGWGQVTKRKPKPGEWVCVSTAMPDRTYQCGLAQPYDEDGKLFVTQRIIPGNSGSAWYDSSGRIIGVATSYRACGVGAECYAYGWPVSSWVELLP